MLRIVALVGGNTIADIPVGNLFLVEALAGRCAVVDASKGVTVRIMEGEGRGASTLVERTYTEAELYPFKNSDD